MCGNGVRTGMETTAAVLRPIRRDRQLAHTVCAVAAAGSTSRGAAECRIVATTLPTTGTAAAASA